MQYHFLACGFCSLSRFSCMANLWQHGEGEREGEFKEWLKLIQVIADIVYDNYEGWISYLTRNSIGFSAYARHGLGKRSLRFLRCCRCFLRFVIAIGQRLLLSVPGELFRFCAVFVGTLPGGRQ
jgi:hypothetical protein